MASLSKTSLLSPLVVVVVLLLLACTTHAQSLSPTFYSTTCPRLRHIVRSTMKAAIRKNPMMGAGVLRLFFHDCFVNGCDASVLLDDTPSMAGEKNAPPNANSLRGFEVIDAIKSRVESSCPATVSCADILALAARDSVALLRGPKWKVLLGRRDARMASQAAAVADLPPPYADLDALTSAFSAKGLNVRDMVALSGAHTIGQSRCSVYRDRVYSWSNIHHMFAAVRQATCPIIGNDRHMTALDLQTPTTFDNKYFKNLVGGRGLLHTDQVLYGGGGVMTDNLVLYYSTNNTAFGKDFAAAMVKMGNISPLTGTLGEIRLNCRKSLLFCLVVVLLLACTTHVRSLSPTFYSTTCPKLRHIVRSTMKAAVQKNPMMGAGILRLFFHDCFVNGCDASVLLDDTPSMAGEKNAPPNANSLRGFEVIDAIKARVESSCPATVSCADILALAARDSVALLHGPKWKVLLGRRDARMASRAAAVADLPPPYAGLGALTSAFAAKGLNVRDMVALSGAHTIGQSRCSVYRDRVYSWRNIHPVFAAVRQATCPIIGNDRHMTALDLQTPTTFDNKYFKNLIGGGGLLHTDQVLYGGGGVMADNLVLYYSANNTAFGKDFAAAMVKMGNISPLTGTLGEIRLNCRKVNS
ncbi:hypothetical protein Cni_G27942 [Canna indica]|uniref:Peroxidase 1 n=1 Tax=Canna indica TaxID=4628 RepID=A0AAQ3L2Y5_9LILI|nr:hypothetical protein Cni_G27942 [Canna indica]